MKYVVKKELSGFRDGKVWKEPLLESLLVGEQSVLTYNLGDPCGHYHHVLFPAFYGGERMWLMTWELHVDVTENECCAEDIGEQTIPFQKGVQILIENEVYSFSKE